MVLCGGLGSRLGSLTASTPKPLLPVGGRPFLDVLLLELVRHGFEHVILLAAFEADQIKAYAKASNIARKHGVRVDVAVEPKGAGTGGALWHARHLAEPEFLLLNGDSWMDANMLSLIDGAGDAEIVLTLRELEDPSRSGVVTLSDGYVREFFPRPQERGPGLVNAGIYFVRRSLLETLAPKCSLEGDILPHLAQRRRVRGVVQDGYFIDIGVPDSYARAQTEVPARLVRPAVFLDRDGVLNHDDGHVGSIERFRWTDGARSAVRKLNDAGRLVFVVTNQAGIARGYYEESDVRRLHRFVQDELRRDGAHIDEFRYCPHHPASAIERYRNVCSCRKPSAGMLLDLMAAWPIDVARSCIIGDKESDLEAGRLAGISGYLFAGGNLDCFVTNLGLSVRRDAY
jgi:D-glycero-D-manno-heptose 1,7-bisphosphate phosphatase